MYMRDLYISARRSFRRVCIQTGTGGTFAANKTDIYLAFHEYSRRQDNTSCRP
jgi:hypothetical protein